VLKVRRVKSPHARGGKKNARAMVRMPTYGRQRRSRHNNTAAAHLSLQTQHTEDCSNLSLSLCLYVFVWDACQVMTDNCCMRMVKNPALFDGCVGWCTIFCMASSSVISQQVLLEA
jgi:hypothetical protein